MKEGLKLKVMGLGRGTPYSVLYSLTCVKCGEEARFLRSHTYFIEGVVGCAEVVYQCDGCKLRWTLASYTAKRRLRVKA
jgi:hypothetical protein